MSTDVKDKGPVARVLDEGTTDSEMDSVLARNHSEVEGLLQEARDAKAQGRFAPLEPLHAFLRRARERFKAVR
jgi:hypothetical protein